MNKSNIKPLGGKSYGSIPHLPNSRTGISDSSISDGQARIATVKVRDNNDTVIVQEKLDGSNVSIALIDGKIYALGRSGYEAKTSSFKMHHAFSCWAYENEDRFRKVLKEGHRLCGEWMHTAHGTIYDLPHEPFVAFDIFNENNERLLYVDFMNTINGEFVTPNTVSIGKSLNVDEVMNLIGKFGAHGSTEQVEGAVWRIERSGKVDFLCKYVRHDKQDGKYLFNGELILNTWPK